MQRKRVIVEKCKKLKRSAHPSGRKASAMRKISESTAHTLLDTVHKNDIYSRITPPSAPFIKYSLFT